MHGVIRSHPVWVRGLKHIAHILCLVPVQVAPCVGAWIETRCLYPGARPCRVAPCVGAWIETLLAHIVRGMTRVAPCVGAWIETSMITMQGTTQNVAPCVVRGLKQKIDATCSRCTLPHLCGCVDRKKQNVENKKGKRRWKVRLPFVKSLTVGN